MQGGRLRADRARERSRPVAAHAHDLESITAAVDAGVDTIEHCTWMSGSLQSFPSRDRAAPVVARLAEDGIAVCPAHPNLYEFFVMMHGPERATEIMERIRWLVDCGVRLLPGTDAGLSPFAGSTETLLRLAAWGFGDAELLDTATVGAAEVLGLPGGGTLDAGHRADLLVLRADPRRDVTALREIELVMAGGRVGVP